MYPLNMTNAGAQGYAVANDENEHESLSDAGYEPKFEKAATAPAKSAAPKTESGETLDKTALQKLLTDAGVDFHPATGEKKLLALATEKGLV